MSFTKFPPRLVLPLMIFIGVLIVGVRTGDIWHTLKDGSLFSPVTHAQAEDRTKSAGAEDKKKEEAQATAAKQDESKGGETKASTKETPSFPRKEAPSPEGDLYKQLAGRRDQLDKRAQELDTREALIRVTETRVDQKMQELETLRAQIQTLLGQAGAAQQAQLENLVKIYEIMKPKEAAKIFETLEMPVLLGVVQRMKPARTAAVMAEMDPQKAKDVTTALTKRDQLPQIK